MNKSFKKTHLRKWNNRWEQVNDSVRVPEDESLRSVLAKWLCLDEVPHKISKRQASEFVFAFPEFKELFHD